MGRSGTADLPLHGGRVPPWLASRMARLGRVIVEAVTHHYGRDELLARLAHPFWFQSLGAVMGMDWHSSGITTSVIGALKRGLAPVEHELGLRVCGGRGRHSRQTPAELMAAAERTGLDGAALARASRLVAKVDGAAVQDGYALYLHGFFLADDGKWAVVQQGMNPERRRARRYHWLSSGLRSFVDDPHAAIDGESEGTIVNLADRRAAASRAAQLALLARGPDEVVRVVSTTPRIAAMLAGPRAQARAALAVSLARTDPSSLTCPAVDLIGDPVGDFIGDSIDPVVARVAAPARRPEPLLLPHLQLPDHHDVRAGDVILRRLHGALAAAAERGPRDFPDLLLTPGVGARTLLSLALVAEVVHGAPSRFSDPARHSLAHGGKDGHPFPVPLRVFDETIRIMRDAVDRAKLGNDDRLAAVRRLDAQARQLETMAEGPSFHDFVAAERRDSHHYGGRTVTGWARPPAKAAPASPSSQPELPGFSRR